MDGDGALKRTPPRDTGLFAPRVRSTISIAAAVSALRTCSPKGRRQSQNVRTITLPFSGVLSLLKNCKDCWMGRGLTPTPSPEKRRGGGLPKPFSDIPGQGLIDIPLCNVESGRFVRLESSNDGTRPDTHLSPNGDTRVSNRLRNRREEIKQQKHAGKSPWETQKLSSSLWPRTLVRR